ncbi:hypothetical protein CgunFtcFv8_026324 [Champsocephalus gunnari]|nr:hypothetical protein CgunFtcFv8_026324 [Champsocephalus gunnari]
MCRSVEEHICNLTAAYIHPGTFLRRSLEQHTGRFDRVTREALVVVHIGTNDVASGLSPAAIVGQMEALIDWIQHGHAEPLYVAVCSIVPRPVDNEWTVRETNRGFRQLCQQKDSCFYLPTGTLFIKKKNTDQLHESGWPPLKC